MASSNEEIHWSLLYFAAQAGAAGFLDGTTSSEEHDDGHPDCAYEAGRGSQHCHDGKQADHVTPFV
jgi:hypothetical protein